MALSHSPSAVIPDSAALHPGYAPAELAVSAPIHSKAVAVRLFSPPWMAGMPKMQEQFSARLTGIPRMREHFPIALAPSALVNGQAARFHGFCPPMPGFRASALWRLAMVYAALARVHEKAARFNGCRSWMMSFCSSCECFLCVDRARAFGGRRFPFVRQGRAVSDERRASRNVG
jgi:hypothetical protein